MTEGVKENENLQITLTFKQSSFIIKLIWIIILTHTSIWNVLNLFLHLLKYVWNYLYYRPAKRFNDKLTLSQNSHRFKFLFIKNAYWNIFIRLKEYILQISISLWLFILIQNSKTGIQRIYYQKFDTKIELFYAVKFKLLLSFKRGVENAISWLSSFFLTQISAEWRRRGQQIRIQLNLRHLISRAAKVSSNKFPLF